MHLEYKCVGVNGFKVLDDNEGVVETIVSVTGIKDNVNDIIEPGAYTKSLQARIPKGVWHHQWHESISRTEDIKELLPGDPELPKTLPNGDPWPSEAGALKVITRFNLETQRGREAYSDVKFFGDQQEWSIGYNVPVGGAIMEKGIRRIKALDLYEYSPVLFGAMPAARTASVKEAQLSFKALNGQEFDEFLVETKSLLDTLPSYKEAALENDDDDQDETEEGDFNPAEDENEEEKIGRPKPRPDRNARFKPHVRLDTRQVGRSPRLRRPSTAYSRNRFKSALDTEMEYLPDSWPEEAFEVLEGKSLEDIEIKGRGLSAAQCEAIERTISALRSLLDSARDDDDEPMSGDEVQKKDIVVEALKAFPDNDEIAKAAARFQVYAEELDGVKMEEAAEPIINAVEQKVDAGEEPDQFAPLVDLIVEGFKAVNETQDDDTDFEDEVDDVDDDDENWDDSDWDDGDDDDDDEDESDTSEEKSGQADVETKVINLDDFKEFLHTSS